MNKKRTVILAVLMLGLLMGGCAQNTANSSKNDIMYNPSMQLIFQSGFADRSFSIGEDYSLSTQFNHVTYVWPAGKGNFSKESNEISFEGKNIKCTVAKHQLIVNGRQIAEFKQGDRVRITGNGEIYINGSKLKSPGDT